MIDKLRSIAIFATVVDQGTFRAAALHLGIAPSRVSETISDLEKDLGVTLLYRSTRQLSLSHEGQLLHEKAQEMLRAAELGVDAINISSSEPAGTLRVTAPAFCTQTALMGSMAAFAKTHPRVSLKLDFSDRPRQLIKDGFDVAIRAGWLKDSELMTRNIGYVDRLLVASPDYVAARGTPSAPADLEAWDWIAFAMRPDHTQLTAADGRDATVTGQSRLSVNSADALYEFATRGLGVTAIPENLATRGFSRGDLVHVLPDWSLKPLGLHAVWPDQTRRENLTRLFVRHLAEDYRARDAGGKADDEGQDEAPHG
ncbi:MAG: LysR family transcriptional regulator [Pseudomonadota bacterium]